MVGDFINIIKTTFDFNFDLYSAFKQHGYTKTWKQREAVNLKSSTLIACKLVNCPKVAQCKLLGKFCIYFLVVPF